MEDAVGTGRGLGSNGVIGATTAAVTTGGGTTVDGTGVAGRDGGGVITRVVVAMVGDAWRTGNDVGCDVTVAAISVDMVITGECTLQYFSRILSAGRLQSATTHRIPRLTTGRPVAE